MSVWEDKIISHLNMKFPEKLWLIVNDCDTGSIGWGPSGETIAIEYEKFQEEYLDNEAGVFKTNNMASFIRQLNLYGFRKCNRYNESKHEFKHPLFVNGRKDLLQFIKRKPGSSINSKSSARITKRSKVNYNAEVSNNQKENIMHDKYLKNDGSISPKEVSKATPKRTPLISCQNSNMMDPMRRLWWNTMSSSPYAANFYCDRSIVQEGWFPMNSPYYNSQTYIKREPQETQGDESDFLEGEVTSKSQLASKNGGNMFYFVVPGYSSSQSHNMYSNPGYYGGMFPYPGMPLRFNTNYSRSTDSHSGEMPVRYEPGN